jgi:hypothetical protein
MKRVDMGQEGEDLSTTREIEHQKQRQKENQTQYQQAEDPGKTRNMALNENLENYAYYAAF